MFLSNHTYHGATVAFVDKRPDNILGKYLSMANYKTFVKINTNILEAIIKEECRRHNDEP